MTEKNQSAARHPALTAQEVESSRRKHGSNALVRKNHNSFLRQFLQAFGDPIIKILLLALGANLLFMLKDFHWYESAGIALAVIIATLVSTLSEYGSEAAFEKLQAEAALTSCRVKRAEGLLEILQSDLVVGDLTLLQPGERVPADGTLLEGGITVDQSALNGETKEVRKYPLSDGEKTKGGHGLSGKNKLFRGSVVCSGEGLMQVDRVGEKSFYGALAAEIQENTIESPLKFRLGKLAGTISRFGYIAAAVVTFAQLFNSIVIANNFSPLLIGVYVRDLNTLVQDIMQALTLAITVIVMAVPEGLPMMITVVLSSNMKRMLKDNVLVRRMVGIETSGSLNILFTDKTGTLTNGRLAVNSFIDSAGREQGLSALKGKKELYSLVLLNCLYNNGASVGTKNGRRTAAIGGNSTDRALLEWVRKDGQNIEGYRVEQRLPFDSGKKFSAVRIRGPQSLYLIKGAPEKLLGSCTHSYNEQGEKRIFQNQAALRKKMKELARQSIRLLALCTGNCSIDSSGRLQNLTLIGLLGIRDNLRPGTRAAVRATQQAGVQVVMITGDNRDTAVSIAEDVGLLSSPRDLVLTSDEMTRMSDSELKEALPYLRVVARALPSDKSRLVRLAQELELVAGMTGDGVNDAPALKKADVGFAMGSGTEVAKEASDIVILDDNITSISKAILYGRTIFKSIRKFIVFQLSINLCAVGVSIIGPLVGVESPVTVIQMLWINLFMDTLAGLAFAGEPTLSEYMREAPKTRGEPIITRYMYSQILFTGLYMIAVCLMFLKIPPLHVHFRLNAGDSYFLTGFFALFIFMGVFNSLNARTHRLNLFSHLFQNKAFIAVMLFVASVQLFLIYFGGALFRTAGLTLSELTTVLRLAFTVIPLDLLRKLVLRLAGRKGTL